jgi:hypothetical protein
MNMRFVCFLMNRSSGSVFSCTRYCADQLIIKIDV